MLVSLLSWASAASGFAPFGDASKSTTTTATAALVHHRDSPAFLLSFSRSARIHESASSRRTSNLDRLRLHLSAFAESPESSVGDVSMSSPPPPTTVDSAPPAAIRNSYPWSESQAWALRDQLPRYTIQVPVMSPNDESTTMQVYTLWRTLTNEVVELAGYPIPFLIEKHQEMLRGEGDDIEEGRVSSVLTCTPGNILPYLDEFEFVTSGGLAGRVYGVVGVADGTRIETTPVGNVQVTVPRGFVATQDGLLYELGRPVVVAADEAAGHSLSLGGTSAPAIHGQRRLSESISERRTPNRDIPLPSAWDPELVQFGALTALVVSGALAFETLQHHLTVNVFWV